MNVLYGDEKIVLPENIFNILRNGFPRITDDKIKYLYSKVTFMVVFQNLKFLFDSYNLDEIDNMNYIITKYFNVDKLVDESSFTKIKDFLCLNHNQGGSIFNPDMRDIFAQLPYDIINEIDAFEILEYPQTIGDLTRYDEVANKNCCLTRVRAIDKII